MFKDERSYQQRLWAAKKFKSQIFFLLGSGFVLKSLLKSSSKEERRKWLEDKNLKCMKWVSNLSTRIDDYKDLSKRLIKLFILGKNSVIIKDPIVQDWVKRNPFWRRFDSSSLPLLPDFKDMEGLPTSGVPTIVIELDEVVASIGYGPDYGWRVMKRPYADEFFKDLMSYYELVIWADIPFPIAQNLVTQWGLPVIGTIHRDHSTPFSKSLNVKDLSKLGRDLRRVIAIDSKEERYCLQPENCLKVKPFLGYHNDNELESLKHFLINLALKKPMDYRPYLNNKTIESYKDSFETQNAYYNKLLNWSKWLVG